MVSTDHLGEVALPGDEADEGDVPVRFLGFHELYELLHLVVEPAEVRGAGGEPQNELVEKEQDSGIPEFIRVTAQDGEAIVEVDELAAFVGEGAEAGL
ncbi:MAG: hypothetical protein WCI05_07460, partial [Myxococcales bacterium]